MDVCDPALAAHAARVATNAEAVAVRLGWTDEELEALRLGAALHDVGKVNVRHDVLTKPGRLEDWELAEIRTHPVEGLWLLSGVTSLAPALPFVLFHHERWDGHGYPTRRAGESIPIQGRILAVADGVRTADLRGHSGTIAFTDEVIRRTKTKLEVWASL